MQVAVAVLIAVLSHSVRPLFRSHSPTHDPCRWYLSPKGRDGRWTAEWTPRRSKAPGESFQTPMDVDVYGAAAPGPGTSWADGQVSSCIRDMQVLALGSHQNAGAPFS